MFINIQFDLYDINLFVQVAKMEVNVPVLKIFVEMMYTPTLDMSSKKKHNLVRDLC